MFFSCQPLETIVDKILPKKNASMKIVFFWKTAPPESYNGPKSNQLPKAIGKQKTNHLDQPKSLLLILAICKKGFQDPKKAPKGSKRVQKAEFSKKEKF